MSFCSRKLSQLDNFLSSVCCSCFLLFLFLSLSPSPLLFFPPSLLPFLSLEHLIGCWTQSPNYSPLFPFHFLVLQLYFMGDFTPTLSSNASNPSIQFFTCCCIFIFQKLSFFLGIFPSYRIQFLFHECFSLSLLSENINSFIYVCVFFFSLSSVSSKCLLFCCFNHCFDI